MSGLNMTSVSRSINEVSIGLAICTETMREILNTDQSFGKFSNPLHCYRLRLPNSILLSVVGVRVEYDIGKSFD